MKRVAVWCLLLASPLAAQTPVAPTDAPVGPRRGQDLGDYVITNSFELGWRFHEVNGSEAQYRSDVNYGNGIRLLGSRFTMNSRDGHGRLFDELVLTTLGLGNDPYETAMLRIAKNRWYRYDMLWRSVDYYNPAFPISFGQHLLDTNRKLQDHDLILLPQSKIKFFAGFSRVSQSGPGLTTVQQFDFRGDEFVLSSNIRRRQNEYRFGNEFQLFGIRVNWTRSWEEYEEDTRDVLPAPSAGNNPQDAVSLDSLSRPQPYRGSTPAWRVNLFREQGRWWALNGRFTNSAGRRNFTFDETALGTNRFGPGQNRQVIVGGDANRPVTTGNLTISLFPAEGLTITNHTLIHTTRIEGNADYTELFNANLQTSTVNFSYLGLRNFTNVTGVHWRLRPWIAIRGGYQYADRLIRSVESVAVEGFQSSLEVRQTNILQAGTAGVQLRPWKPFTLTLDGELGRTNKPFYPISDKDYHGLNGRAQYRTRSLTLGAQARANYNFNSVSLFSHSARNRTYSFDGGWNLSDRLAIEGSYSFLHTDTLTGLAYFAASQLITGDRSLYISNLHAGQIGLRGTLRQRVDWYVGYSRTQDTGDGRAILDQASGQAAQATSQPAFLQAQTFPMTFESPQARLSIRLHERLRWNVGYQYYRYLDSWYPLQNYRAHTGYTSVLWSF